MEDTENVVPSLALVMGRLASFQSCGSQVKASQSKSSQGCLMFMYGLDLTQSKCQVSRLAIALHPQRTVRNSFFRGPDCPDRRPRRPPRHARARLRTKLPVLREQIPARPATCCAADHEHSPVPCWLSLHRVPLSSDPVPLILAIARTSSPQFASL